MADYNINAITRRVVFTGSAGLGPYAFSFEILDQDDLAVYFNATSLTITTDYTVTINANGTGSVNIVTGGSVPSTPTGSDQIIIVGARDIERVTDFVTAGDLLASSLNEQLDALTIFDQQLAEEGQRSMRAPVYDPALVADGGVVNMTLPAKADRAGRFLAFDTNGNPTATTNVGDFKGDWAASTVYRIGDLVRDTTDDSIYRVNTDHTSSGSLPLNTNTNAAFYDLFVDLSDINASEAAAAASATEAEEWASKTNGIVDGTDYSSKAYALGGTGVTNTSGKGAAKEWATTTGGTVDTSEYSSKEYAIGTTVAAGSSKDWASQASGTVDGSEYSAKYYSGQASTSASNAATSETNASNSASAAASAQTAAEAARDAALAAYDDFDDRYLGDFASNPTTDNDGDPLAAGMLYFNTTDDTMKVYTGSGWVAAYVSGTGFLATTGGTMTGDINFGDSDKCIFGAGSDLQIYHNGGNSIISDVGTGDLYVAGDNLRLTNAALSEVYARGYANGKFSLYYDNAEKLATTATGVDVTGDVALQTSDGPILNLKSTDSTLVADDVVGSITFETADSSSAGVAAKIEALGENPSGGVGLNFFSGFGGSPVKRMTIDRNGSVGIGTSSPQYKLAVSNNGGNGLEVRPDFSGDTETRINSYNRTGSNYTTLSFDTGVVKFRQFGTTDALTIDSSGNVLVGTTLTPGTLPATTTDTGFATGLAGLTTIVRSGGTVIEANRLASDGTIINFRKDGTTVGSIGVVFSVPIFNTSTSTGALGVGGTSIYQWDSNQFYPLLDNSKNVGAASYRFDDIYATNGTIQTSDANEKQQIAALTDAEITAAKSISQLFKTYKWNSAVEAKGDAARTHAGVIAQDVQAAMTAAGLDAGNYAFFISSTWWETQTEVPAVEAVEAVDAVYEDVVIRAVEEELDEDGNVIVEAQPERTEQRLVSEAIEAVEAVAAYTRTDTYDTAEEAPEGATERTRLGIRYPELLAFVGAATEQRLANIETRLAALEA